MNDMKDTAAVVASIARALPTATNFEFYTNAFGHDAVAFDYEGIRYCGECSYPIKLDESRGNFAVGTGAAMELSAKINLPTVNAGHEPKPISEMTMADIEAWARQHLPQGATIQIEITHYRHGGCEFVSEASMYVDEKWRDINPQRTLDDAMAQINPPKTMLAEIASEAAMREATE
ncbi:MAG: hypothetical protein ABFD92_16645 [Planctomycetaceae bacterium]|nr:hypothetical protein [Planctomycetaceae bacterium]